MDIKKYIPQSRSVVSLQIRLVRAITAEVTGVAGQDRKVSRAESRKLSELTDKAYYSQVRSTQSVKIAEEEIYLDAIDSADEDLRNADTNNDGFLDPLELTAPFASGQTAVKYILREDVLENSKVQTVSKWADLLEKAYKKPGKLEQSYTGLRLETVKKARSADAAAKIMFGIDVAKVHDVKEGAYLQSAVTMTTFHAYLKDRHVAPELTGNPLSIQSETPLIFSKLTNLKRYQQVFPGSATQVETIVGQTPEGSWVGFQSTRY